MGGALALALFAHHTLNVAGDTQLSALATIRLGARRHTDTPSRATATYAGDPTGSRLASWLRLICATVFAIVVWSLVRFVAGIEHVNLPVVALEMVLRHAIAVPRDTNLSGLIALVARFPV